MHASLFEFINFIHLQAPLLGKAVDYLLTAELKEKSLRMVFPQASQAMEMVSKRSAWLQRLAGKFWPKPVAIELATRKVEGELRLLPVESSKFWNDIVFFLQLGNAGCDDYTSQKGIAACIFAKPDYEQLKRKLLLEQDIEPQTLIEECQGEFFMPTTLAELVVIAGRRAQKKRGYCHFISLCVEPDNFLQLDYYFYRLKEFGVGAFGPFLSRSVLGRLHAVFPGQFCAGLTVLHLLANNIN